MPGWKKEKGALSGRSAQYIRCPYFIAHSERAILCNGVIPGTRTEHKFKYAAEKTKQQNIFCEGCYEKCEHHIAVKHFNWEEEEK